VSEELEPHASVEELKGAEQIGAYRQQQRIIKLLEKNGMFDAVDLIKQKPVIVDDPDPNIKKATERISFDIDEATELVVNLFIQEGKIQERERIADWVNAHRTEVTDGVWRDHFNSEYLLKNVIPLSEVERED
jgi:hypothetical protein